MSEGKGKMMREGKDKMMTKLLQCTAAALMGAVLMLEVPLAQAGGSERYDAPKRSGPSVWDRMTGGMNTGGFADTASNFYIAGRGALLIYDDDPVIDVAPVSGYEPRRAANAVFSSVLGTWSAEPSSLAGGGGAALGYALPFDIPFGGVRLEFDYGYQQYKLDVCTASLLPPPLNIDVRPEAQLVADARTPDVAAGTTMLTAADIAIAAQNLLRNVILSEDYQACEAHDEPVHTFLFNALYDIDLVKAMDAFGFAGMNALAGLGMHFGIGVGYMLVEEDLDSIRTTRTVVEESREPDLVVGTTPSGTISDANIIFLLGGGAGDGDTVVNLEDAELLESGFYLPVYVGLNYSLQAMLNVPVTLEATYRYNAVGPDNLGEHGMIFGARYHF